MTLFIAANSQCSPSLDVSCISQEIVHPNGDKALIITQGCAWLQLALPSQTKKINYKAENNFSSFSGLTLV